MNDEMEDMITYNNIIDGKLVRDIAYDDKIDDVTSLWRNMELVKIRELTKYQ